MTAGTATSVALLGVVPILAGFFLLSSPLGPLLAIASLSLGIVVAARTLNSRQGSILELGVFYAVVVALYGIYPLGVYWLNGDAFLPTNDMRLYLAQPTPQEVASVGWFYVVYLAAFVMAYLLLRGPIQNRGAVLHGRSNNTVVLLLGIYLLIQMSLLGMEWIAGFERTTYAGSYLRYKDLPLLAQQLAKHLEWIATALKIAAVTALATNFKKYWVLIAVWIGVEVFFVIYGLGSRTELFVMLAALAIGYDYVVRPLKAKQIMMFGISGLLLFLVLGVIRSGGDIADTPVLLVTSAGEFESVFATALEISDLVSTASVGDVPTSAFFGDVLSFVPQQLLPFVKWDFATWYVTEFHYQYHESGGGLAFGVIPESMLGLGMVGLVIRGVVIGVLFAIAVRVAMNRRTSFWIAALYVWLTVQSYLMFRSGGIPLLPMLILGFLPAVVMIKTLDLDRRTQKLMERAE